MYDQVRYRLGIDDYLSALMDRSKNLKRNIDIYIYIYIYIYIVIS